MKEKGKTSEKEINRPTISNEIKLVLKNLPINISLGPDSFTGEFHQKFKEELILILLKLFQKIKKKGGRGLRGINY